jgi:hypothetical protein
MPKAEEPQKRVNLNALLIEGELMKISQVVRIYQKSCPICQLQKSLPIQYHLKK